MPAGIICSDTDYERSLHDHSITCLTRSSTIGVVVSHQLPGCSMPLSQAQLTVESGFVSILSILFVFGLIGVSTSLSLPCRTECDSTPLSGIFSCNPSSCHQLDCACSTNRWTYSWYSLVIHLSLRPGTEIPASSLYSLLTLCKRWE